MKHIFSSLIILVVLASYSCHSTRKIQTAIEKKDTAQVIVVRDTKADSIKFIHDVFEKVKSNRIDFKTFSAKIKVDYYDKNGKGPDLSVFVRMIKDSAIWLSINATVFSYEAYRVLITPDSVKVLNKKDKQVQLRSVSYLQELIQLPFDFNTVQDLMIGNPIYLDSNIVSFKKTQSSLLLLMSGELFKHLLTLSNENYVLEHSKLDDVHQNRNRTCDLTYGNYETRNAVRFSTLRKITVSEKSKLDIDMDIKQYSFNEILSLPFSIPKNYKPD
jgi:hypothetical protein